MRYVLGDRREILYPMTTRTLDVFVSCRFSATSTFAFPFGSPFSHEPNEFFCSKRDFWSKRSFPPSHTIRLARSAHASITNLCGGKQYCAHKPQLALDLVTSERNTPSDRDTSYRGKSGPISSPSQRDAEHALGTHENRHSGDTGTHGRSQQRANGRTSRPH